MVDTHYDLLSIAYVCYLKGDYSKIINIANEIKESGVKSVFANLYFMSKEEMENELDSNYYRDGVSVIDMFKISKQLLEHYLPHIDFIYSIEGCDHVDNSDLKELYKLGLRSVILVWNTENRYGSGNRTDHGLTEDGKEFLKNAIDLGIGIDLSHANDNTFYDMVKLIKEEQNNGKDVICFASHSNARTLCSRIRNLTDKELECIKDVGGLVGVFSNKNFVSDKKSLSKRELELQYLKQIIYIANIIGKDKVMLSTDDMRFCGDIDPEYLDLPIYEYKSLASNIRNTLKLYFNDDDIENIMYNNANEKIINKLKERRNKYDRH